MDNSSLYRFISFESFVDIIQSKSIKLVQPKLWEDPYESYLLKAIKSDDGRQKIKQILEEIYDNNEESIKFAFMIINSLMNNYYGQCWTINPESDAFWRIYSYNQKAIRIEIDYESVNKLKDVKAYTVEYKNDISLREELMSVTNMNENGISLEKAFIRKRSAFEHEKEVRLLICNQNFDNIAVDKRTLSPEEVYKELKEQLEEFEEFEELEKLEELEGLLRNRNVNMWDFISCAEEIPSIQVDESIEFNNGDNVKPSVEVNYSHVNNFIKSVMLHPLAPDWFDSTLKEYCNINNLNYLGKSKLYDYVLK